MFGIYIVIHVFKRFKIYLILIIYILYSKNDLSIQFSIFVFKCRIGSPPTFFLSKVTTYFTLNIFLNTYQMFQNKAFNIILKSQKCLVKQEYIFPNL